MLRSLGLIALLLGGVVGLQQVREQVAPASARHQILYVRSTAVMQRLALSFDALLADIYWIRAIQHYGGTKLGTGPKDYALLYPLLDLTTSLDPRFNVAYRFGSIFLAEPSPAGAGDPDAAIRLLEKGLRAQPHRWEYAQDVGFIHYWWKQDYQKAAAWFRRASMIPGAPDWMAPLAAVTEAQGGNRAGSRQLWGEILKGEPHEWLKAQASFRLRQLDALDQIDSLSRVVSAYRDRTGRVPRSWAELGARRLPLDPDGFAYRIHPETGQVLPDPASTINPLPTTGAGR